MSAIDDPKALGRARLSFADQHDIDEFIATLEKFERGEIGPEQWRKFRLVRGTYGQRQDGDVHMLRVKVPQGVLDALQLYALATVAETYSRGFGHITTRQNIQFHFVKLHDVELAMQLLADVGVTTREACGNSVRNITSCPYAGVAKSELFDVTPFADALNGCGLNHIAGIGFQGGMRKVGTKAVPQYFVTVGGAVNEGGASFGRTAAKIPARRIAVALERLIGLYQADRQSGETATGFFGRIELPRVKQLLADLEVMTPEAAQTEDYVDLAETDEFRPQTMAGECAS